MAKVKLNLKSLLDQHIEPIASAIPFGRDAYRALMTLIGPAINRDFDIDVPDLPVPAAGGAAPIDPSKALGDIAKAIRQAEQTLLGENLSIRSATVDVELTVAVAGAAGATAKFNLEIGPTPTD